MHRSLRGSLTALLLLFGLLHFSWWLLRWGTPAQQPWLAGLLYVPIFLIAGLSGGLTARQATGRERAAWLCLSFGLLSWGLGQTVFTFLQVTFDQAPFPSIADALFLLFPVLVGVALVLLPHAPLSRATWLRLGLDIGITTAAAAVFSWRYLLSGLVLAYQGKPLAGGIALAYPASDLMLLSLLLLLITRRQRLPGQVVTAIALGLTAFIVADTGFAQQSASNTYVPGNTIDLFWGLGGLLFGLAGQTRTTRSVGAQVQRPSVSAESRVQGWLTYGPYAAVIAAYFLLARTFNGTTDFRERGVLWATLLVTLLVMARQVVAFLENARLNSALHAAAQELEVRVDERTAELHRVNSQLKEFSDGLEETVRARTAELEASQARLAHQAQHDGLTGLPNRTLFEDRLNQAVAAAARHGRLLAVVYLDLDGFKLVNDTLGHAAGDELLRVTAGRLQNLVRASDTVARMGGDEFTLLLTDLTDPASVSSLARRLLEAVGQEMRIDGRPASVTGSLGIALYPDDALDAATLKRQADSAMYRAKQGGKNNVCFFAPEMNSASQVRKDLAGRLRGAAERHEFHLAYQPLFDTAGPSLCGFEALLRWSPQDLGPVPPSEFIPIAEESGLIVQIGAWVLREVCRQQAQWQRSGLPPVFVAVNVSPLQFAAPGFVEDLRHTLREHALDGRWLELELTEQIMLHDLAGVARKMAEIRSLGTRISIDDFGAGKTALSYLMELPVNTVKIDRSLVRNLGDTQGGRRVVQAIVALAHALRLDVVAEGVETHAQLSGVTEMRCERVQGFLLGMPEAEPAARLRLQAKGPSASAPPR